MESDVPASNFFLMRLKNFPGLFFATTNTNDYLFIIYGFVQADINGISLNDIDVGLPTLLNGKFSVPFFKNLRLFMQGRNSFVSSKNK